MHQDKGGKVFYIGKGMVSGTGRGYRHLSWDCRSKEWEEVAKKGYTSQILTYGSERDMLYLEKYMIESLTESGVKLINKMYNVHVKHREGVKTWRHNKSSDLYKQTRRQQRKEFYKQKEAA
tara:strand:- start:185 stop:547 length:363 start_codon:yes stop_codon:yes gene_type:complete